jgi:H-type lectin domain
MTAGVLPLSFVAGAVRFDESEPGWTLLDTSEEPERSRICRRRVNFERGFLSPPVVQIGITGFDIDHRDNARLDVEIVGVDGDGFSVELRTWWNTRLWSVKLNWIAVGH